MMRKKQHKTPLTLKTQKKKDNPLNLQAQQPPLSQAKKFDKLRTQWYQKLKDSGFEDIEDTHSPNEYLNAWHSSYFQTRYDRDEFEEKREYYDRARSYLEEQMQTIEYLIFSKQIDRLIWELYSEGMSLRQIAKALNTNKDKVQKIVKVISNKMLGVK